MARPAPSSTADQHPGAGYTSLCFPPELDDHQDWQQICEQVKVSPYQGIPSPDTLLERGLGDYTIVPNGILGKGKFSVVYRAEKAGIEVCTLGSPSVFNTRLTGFSVCKCLCSMQSNIPHCIPIIR